MRLTTTKKKEPELFDDLENINENEYFIKVQTDEPTTWQCVADKLGQYEDIEDELCIDLLTLFKTLENGVFHKYPLDKEIYKIKGEYISIGKKGLVVAYDDDFDDRILYILPYEQYGKTWALTKEELE